MSFTIDEKTIGIWYVQLGKDKDWMSVMSRKDEGSHEIMYRFRYYNSDDPWDQKDKKNWYVGSIKLTDTAEVIQRQRQIVTVLQAASDGKAWELLRDNKTFDEFMEEFNHLPFVHKREVTKEEADRFGVEVFQTRTQ